MEDKLRERLHSRNLNKDELAAEKDKIIQEKTRQKKKERKRKKKKE